MLLHVSPMELPSFTPGKIVGSALILSRAYSIASIYWYPGFELNDPHVESRTPSLCMGNSPPSMMSPSVFKTLAETRKAMFTLKLTSKLAHHLGAMFGVSYTGPDNKISCE